MKMKTTLKLAGLVVSLLIIFTSCTIGQDENSIIEMYLRELPAVPVSNALQKYRMTAVYTNRDLYGNFRDRVKVVGDYTRGLESGFVTWKNIYISSSKSLSEPFTAATRQEYMENIKYVPSPKMLESEAFKDFPADPMSVLAKNLIWDMMAIEEFAWSHTDSLKLNRIYRIHDSLEEFTLADIGTYTQTEVQVCWTGLSAINNELCSVIEYRAIDNMIELSMDAVKTKGTEQYWGTIWVSLKTRSILSANMYGGSIQEISVPGISNKFVVKTIRELWLDKIQ